VLRVVKQNKQNHYVMSLGTLKKMKAYRNRIFLNMIASNKLTMNMWQSN